MHKTITKYIIRLLALLAFLSLFYQHWDGEAYELGYRLGRSIFE